MSILNACKCRGKKNSFTNDFESSSIQLINDWFWPYGWKKGCWIKHQSNIPAHAAKSGGFVEWREIETKNRRSYFMMFIIYRPRWRFRAHFHHWWLHTDRDAPPFSLSNDSTFRMHRFYNACSHHPAFQWSIGGFLCHFCLYSKSCSDAIE